MDHYDDHDRLRRLVLPPRYFGVSHRCVTEVNDEIKSGKPPTIVATEKVTGQAGIESFVFKMYPHGEEPPRLTPEDAEPGQPQPKGPSPNATAA